MTQHVGLRQAAQGNGRVMFEGLEETVVDTNRGGLFVRVGGSGAPILLLHGYPQTHEMWHAVVGSLTDEHTVIVADLPGYGADPAAPTA